MGGDEGRRTVGRRGGGLLVVYANTVAFITLSSCIGTAVCPGYAHACSGMVCGVIVYRQWSGGELHGCELW